MSWALIRDRSSDWNERGKGPNRWRDSCREEVYEDIFAGAIINARPYAGYALRYQKVDALLPRLYDSVRVPLNKRSYTVLKP